MPEEDVPEEIESTPTSSTKRFTKRLEREGGTLLKAIALTTALFAALAAVAALRAGGTVNEALVMKTEATRLQAEASDQWAAYQAKGIKSAIQRGVRVSLARAGQTAARVVRRGAPALRARASRTRAGRPRQGA